MANNGPQQAEENYQKFMTWVSGKTDEDFKQYEYRNGLNRSDICKECGFARSVFEGKNGNPKIQAALRALEDGLRAREVFVARAPIELAEGELPPRPASSRKQMEDAARLRKVEEDLACARAEIRMLKDELERFTTIKEVLARTGRVPR